VKEPIEIARMRDAARLFVGMRDFQSFAQRDAGDGDEARSTRVLVDRLDVVDAGDLLLIGIEGSHFLWKMVRRVVGVLAEIGRGGLEPAAAEAFLTGSSATPARLTAPASGLFLERVSYQGDPPMPELRPITALAEHTKS
jgi:tRNA pseudouridine38-40 synthase